MPLDIEPFYRELGQRIRDLRTAKGLTQGDLGDLLDPQVTRASIANIEVGAQRVLAHTLVQLAQHLDTPIEGLLPSSRPKGLLQDDADLKDELNERLNLSSKRVDQLVRRLTSSGGRK